MAGNVPIHSVVAVNDATAVQLCPDRPSRRSVILYNNSIQYLYVMYGNGASSATFTIKVPPDWYGVMPWGLLYTGIITGRWAGPDAGGNVQVTELIH